MTHNHYILTEDLEIEEVSLLEWGDYIGKSNRTIGKASLSNGASVSTVFLGIDHNFSIDGPPLLFETMVFGPDDGGEEGCWRYATVAEAITGHKNVVQKETLGRNITIEEEYIVEYNEKITKRVLEYGKEDCSDILRRCLVPLVKS